MKLNVAVREIAPRSWKSSKGSSEGHQIEGLLLEIGADMTIGATIPFMQKATSKEESERLAGIFAGKNAVFVVKTLSTTQSGEAQLVGALESASK